MSIVTFLESVSQKVTHANLLSEGSAWALVLEFVSTDTGSVLEFVSIDAGSALEFVSTDTGSAWSWSSFLKWEESQVTFRSPPSAVSILWFLFVTVSQTGWYGVENFPVFSCFTNALSPTCMWESLIGLLLSAWVFILRFWCASSSGISACFKFVLHVTATEQGSLILIGFPMRAVVGATQVVQWGVVR